VGEAERVVAGTLNNSCPRTWLLAISLEVRLCFRQKRELAAIWVARGSVRCLFALSFMQGSESGTPVNQRHFTTSQRLASHGQKCLRVVSSVAKMSTTVKVVS
jgi:hypothetical protein